MAAKQGFAAKFETFQASKTVVFWACTGCVAATIILGFNWGGWVTGGTARKMTAEAGMDARADLVAGVCVDRFGRDGDATAKLVALKGTDTWKREEFIVKGGWMAIDGQKDSVSGAGQLCAQRLIDAKPAK